MLKFGIITETKPGLARVKFIENDIVSGWLQVLTAKAAKDKFSNPPDINAQVCCLMDDNLEYGVVLGELPNEIDKPDSGEGVGKDRKKYSDGTVIEYNRITGIYKIDGPKQVTIKASVSVDLTAPVVNITGNVIISGTVAAAGFTGAGGGPMAGAAGGPIKVANLEATGDVKAGLVSLATHKHTGVQTGPGVTGLPV